MQSLPLILSSEETKVSGFSKLSKLHQFQQSTPQLKIQVCKTKESLRAHESKHDSLQEELSEYTNNYEELEILGEGFQSICKKVRNKVTQELRVAKINILTIDEETVNCLKQENIILKQLECQENIMKPYEIFETSTHFIQIVEFIDAQSLLDLLPSYNFTEQEIISIAFSMLKILKGIHQKDIIHRDITLSNILYSKRNNILKLIDFGVAKQLNKDQILNFSQTGNSAFKAPEMLKKQIYTNKIDLWGLGIVLYSLIQNKIIGSKCIIQQLKLNQTIQFPENISKNLQNLLSGLLTLKAKQRLSAEEALNHALFNN